jgi:hypothetical protein
MQTVWRTGAAMEAFGRARIRTELKRGMWQRPERGVVVTHNGALTPREDIEVALALCPPAAAIGGITALELDGFQPVRHSRPQVILPEGARAPRSTRVITHWSTKLDERDVHPTRTPRRTRPARSVVDQASWSSTDRAARSVVLAAMQQGLVSPRSVREALTRRGTCHWRAVIVQSVLDAAGGIQSLPERDFDEICRSRRLPRSTRQRTLKRPDGRAFLDVSWDEFDVAVEIHGIPHMLVQEWDADLDRANEVMIAGPRLLAFTSFAVRHRKQRVGDQVEALLRRSGWPGPNEG